MLILGVDTATPQIGLALGGEGGIRGEVRLSGGRRHAEALPPAIEYLLGECGVTVGDLSALAVGTGPGLFTGLRVGVATAKVMAAALDVPVVAVPSLDLVAHPVRFTGRLIAAVTDARRGEVYAAWYRPAPGSVERVRAPEVALPGEAAAALAATGEDVLLVGDAAAAHPEHLAGLERVELASPAFAHPSPSALVELACAAARREEFCAPEDVHPLYLRKSDAEIAWERTWAR